MSDIHYASVNQNYIYQNNYYNNRVVLIFDQSFLISIISVEQKKVKRGEKWGKHTKILNEHNPT